MRWGFTASYPNPFNVENSLRAAETAIRFTLAKASRVQLAIFDALGRQARILADRGFASGMHTMQWDGRDANGRRLPAGIYFYRLRAGNSEQVKKLTLFH